MNIYVEQGYENRKDYFLYLEDCYGVPIQIIKDMASILGSEEDFDGLVSSVGDYEWQHRDRG